MKEEAGQSCVVTVMIRIYALKSFRAFFYMETKDREYMNRARILADRGRGWVNPNPLVGAVIVKDGRIIGEGWHERYGGLHAERNAFKQCTEAYLAGNQGECIDDDYL